MKPPSLFPTRAQAIGIKPKILLARTRKALAHHRYALAKLAEPYRDVDNSVEGALLELLAAFDIFQGYLITTAEWLNKEFPT